jgi:SAM-dependent methyltransferase
MPDFKTEVRKTYAEIATGTSASCCASTTCCPGDAAEGTGTVPKGADLGLGCGLPTRFADIRPGETVLDLGSGARVDVFRAAESVGAEGRAIGVDMTPEMVGLARRNASEADCRNVEFLQGDLEALPLPAGSVDVVLSNCVINLVPDKGRVFSEMFRVLRRPDPTSGTGGGRFSISDVVTFGAVPEAVREDVKLWTGCIAGAMDEEEYMGMIRAAGFTEVRVRDRVRYDVYPGESYGAASLTVEGRKS